MGDKCHGRCMRTAGAWLGLGRGARAWVVHGHWWCMGMSGVCTPPPPLYKLRPCPSYSRLRDRINLVPNFNSVPNVVQPRGVWGMAHGFDGKLYFTRDHMQGNFIPKDLKLPQPKPAPQP